MDKTQQGVARGMALALIAALVVFALASICLPTLSNWRVDLPARLWLGSWSILLPVATLLACVARLAKHRFFTPEDINGSALTAGTDRARLLQSLLQNTLEQTCLAVPVYFAGAVMAPAFLLPTIPAAGLMFLVGRLSFFAGYARGAPARAFGFALTFYPTAILLVTLVVVGTMQWVTGAGIY